jgi:hypothetical protein
MLSTPLRDIEVTGMVGCPAALASSAFLLDLSSNPYSFVQVFSRVVHFDVALLTEVTPLLRKDLIRVECAEQP